MKKLLFIFLSLLLPGAFAPSQSYACGAGCKKESTPAACETEKEKSCCAKANKTQDCCQKNIDGRPSGNHDCGGKCGGKCGANCSCPAVHFAAITT